MFKIQLGCVSKFAPLISPSKQDTNITMMDESEELRHQLIEAICNPPLLPQLVEEAFYQNRFLVFVNVKVPRINRI